MATVYLGLGTNLGDRLANLRAALAALAELGEVEARSRVYETAPMLMLDQPSFLNMAVRLRTALEPRPLLARLKDIEARLGRVAAVRYGPRLIDLDILFYDGLVMDEPDLVIPHPRLPERRFALAPLADIAADFRHPLDGRAVDDLLDCLPAAPDDIVPVAEALA